jgi:hypothetical protein
LSTAKVIFKVPLPPLQDQDAQHLPSSIERGGNLFGPSQGTPIEEGGGPNGTLVSSTETDGIDHNQILSLIRKIQVGT